MKNEDINQLTWPSILQPFMPSRFFYDLQVTMGDSSLGFIIGTYMFEVFLYGLYTTIFIFCMHTVWLNRRPTRVPFVMAALLLFGIATADIVIGLYHLFRQMLNDSHAPNPYTRVVFFISNNIIADSLLIYRFYVFWFRRPYFIIIPCLVLFSSSLCGYLSLFSALKFDNLYPVYLWMILGLNLTLSVLIAVKFLWSARRAQMVYGSAFVRFVYPICPMLIESGLIYSAYLLVHQLVHSMFLSTGLSQIVAIAPTLIIIRASIAGLNHENTIHGRGGASGDADTDNGTSSTPVLDSLFSTVGTAAQMSPQSGLRLRMDNGTQTHLPTEEGRIPSEIV